MSAEESKLFSNTWLTRTSRLPFLRSLVIVFEQFREEKMEPSASYWTTHHAYLAKYALPRIRAEWAKQTGMDEILFPWTDDEVSLTWEEWRKTNQKYREGYCKELGLDHIGQWYVNKAKVTRSGKNDQSVVGNSPQG